MPKMKLQIKVSGATEQHDFFLSFFQLPLVALFIKRRRGRMELPQAFTFPNSHNAHMGEMMSPLVPDRVCELSVECCFLRNDITDKEHQNEQLQSSINRMKTAVKRGSNTLKNTVELNKDLETKNAKLTMELMTTQKKLMKAESKVSFQSKVIENNRKVITKLKTPADGVDGKVDKNIAQIMTDNAKLTVTVADITADLTRERAEQKENQVDLLNDVNVLMIYHCSSMSCLSYACGSDPCARASSTLLTSRISLTLCSTS